MKKRVLIALVVVLALAATASAVWAGGEGTFGGYVRTLARAGVPDVLDMLGLDFGAIFVSPVTGTIPNIIDDVPDPNTTVQMWVVTEDFEYAVQWWTFGPNPPWGTEGHDYIAVWSKERVSDLQNLHIDFDQSWASIYPLAGHGWYWGVQFDVTD